uniref:Uncharacterized protein n=1 Tax=Tetradesmus obliquus TaxID=3088 RepID=A0A383VQR6_TETOB
MGNEHVDKLVEGAIRGGAVGAGFEAIRSGKEWKGLADGLISGVVLGAAWKGVTILSDKAGLTKQVNKAKDKILNR